MQLGNFSYCDNPNPVIPNFHFNATFQYNMDTSKSRHAKVNNPVMARNQNIT